MTSELHIAADDLAFVFGNEDASSYPQSVHIDEAYWNTIISFTELTGCLLVWDLCAYSMRNPDDSWDHTNAEVLFSHMQQHSQSIYGFQLGNEPGIYLKKQGYMPAATQIGEDLHTLRTLLQTYFPANEVSVCVRLLQPTAMLLLIHQSHPCAGLRYYITSVFVLCRF